MKIVVIKFKPLLEIDMNNEKVKLFFSACSISIVRR